MRIIQRKQVQPLGLTVCPSCDGSGQITYLSVGTDGVSSHHRPCTHCDQFGYVKAAGGSR